MASRKLLLHAARLLDGQAKVWRESCQIRKPGGAKPLEWACRDCNVAKCSTKKGHDELKRTAKRLRDAA